MLSEYDDKMRPHESKLPPFRPGFDHKIEFENKNQGPVKSKAYPLNAKDGKIMATELAALWEKGFIRKSDSPHASPAFVAAEKNGKKARLCIDFRKMNGLIKKRASPPPVIKSLFSQLKGTRVMSKIDIRSAFN
jgi:hypothetical protein